MVEAERQTVERMRNQRSVITLPEALCRPEAFPDPPPGEVVLASTHASWVFIAGDEVWKVKRPVDFGFLDYSDRGKRQRACEDEVRLGVRLASDVYRGVVPVYRGAAGLSFAGPGEVVDFAVRMRRLDEADSARTMLQEGRLAREHLTQLAALLADFYASVPAVPELGAASIFAANVEENFQQTLPYVDRLVSGRVLQRLHRWQQGALVAGATALAQRLADEKIREGHGDLRLEHVFFPAGGTPLVIDPIEFNRRFRCIDVALDVAFLAMELEAADRASLAGFFLGCFARDSNDYGFYPLLDLYLSYRAWVRAKVACFVAADPTTDAKKARRKAVEAERLFSLALAYADSPPRSTDVIAIGGLPGSGKSTMADALSFELGLPAISSDRTRKFLGGLPAHAPGGEALYSGEMTRRTYDEVLRRAGQVLRSGRGVILDATFGDPTARAAARALAEREGRRFLFVEMSCDEVTLRQRLRIRTTHPSESDAREELLPMLIARFRPPTELSASETMVLDGRAGMGPVLRRLRDRQV